MALKIMRYCKSEFLQKQSEVDPKLVCKREHLVRTSSINTSVNFFCVAWIQRVYNCDRICQVWVMGLSFSSMVATDTARRLVVGCGSWVSAFPAWWLQTRPGGWWSGVGRGSQLFQHGGYRHGQEAGGRVWVVGLSFSSMVATDTARRLVVGCGSWVSAFPAWWLQTQPGGWWPGVGRGSQLFQHGGYRHGQEAGGRAWVVGLSFSSMVATDTARRLVVGCGSWVSAFPAWWLQTQPGGWWSGVGRGSQLFQHGGYRHGQEAGGRAWVVGLSFSSMVATDTARRLVVGCGSWVSAFPAWWLQTRPGGWWSGVGHGSQLFQHGGYRHSQEAGGRVWVVGLSFSSMVATDTARRLVVGCGSWVSAFPAWWLQTQPGGWWSGVGRGSQLFQHGGYNTARRLVVGCGSWVSAFPALVATTQPGGWWLGVGHGSQLFQHGGYNTARRLVVGCGSWVSAFPAWWLQHSQEAGGWVWVMGLSFSSMVATTQPGGWWLGVGHGSQLFQHGGYRHSQEAGGWVWVMGLSFSSMVATDTARRLVVGCGSWVSAFPAWWLQTQPGGWWLGVGRGSQLFQHGGYRHGQEAGGWVWVMGLSFSSIVAKTQLGGWWLGVGHGSQLFQHCG